jgi:hypothetical protein
MQPAPARAGRSRDGRAKPGAGESASVADLAEASVLLAIAYEDQGRGTSCIRSRVLQPAVRARMIARGSEMASPETWRWLESVLRLNRERPSIACRCGSGRLDAANGDLDRLTGR